ncbi:hypothetical protein ZYGR_0P03780 [Zygosaccharomyces rouxii]|uniref:ER membrane protein complex subunit 4 n=2 Tax=Zygosaccharomyces rouxii TaxID=4956 RepID=C5E4W1_ZYGRC|nr:uncharacterized protein ZYRO0E09196g [Zygosaccharomyces rouxii]KAH9198073.1 hypothetical protein LQ764DRAFT_146327 [Zygosaccharomyces rouxii]GAV49732.1 hypothetical protein ZYGR_0P03780 [Zygosaccharomyces rouxii]CAR31072.1 ZYRO0E09196p [Zygosaccharomyces rouxii]
MSKVDAAAVEPHQWATNLTDSKYAKNLTIVTSNSMPSPSGFSSIESTGRDSLEGRKNKFNSHVKSEDVVTLQMQKAWQIALAPAKSIPMNFFMSYMSGTSLQIIPIMTALMLLSGPIKSIFQVRANFRPVLGTSVTESQILVPMLVFIACQFALMYIGFQKLNSMGLIPNTTSDWLSWEKRIDYNNGIRSFSF